MKRNDVKNNALIVFSIFLIFSVFFMTGYKITNLKKERFELQKSIEEKNSLITTLSLKSAEKDKKLEMFSSQKVDLSQTIRDCEKSLMLYKSYIYIN